MKRWLVTIAFAVTCAVRLGADVTITMTTTVDGGRAAAAGGGLSPTIVTRIKGNKSRTDVDMGQNSVATLVDLTTKQAIILQPNQKTAQILDPAAMKSGAPANMPMPKVDTSVKPTGKTRDIDGNKCTEYAVSMRMDMASMAGGRGDMPADAAAAMKDLRMTMTGFIWVAKDAPGGAEYQAFQTGASKLMAAALSGGRPGGMPSGMEQLITGFGDAPGIPYLTELTMGIEGTGPIVEMMKKMGEMKIISRVKSISTDPIPDALLAVPDGYKMVKQ